MKIFLRETRFADGCLKLGREQKKRIVKVMRLQTGDTLEVLSPEGRWECRVGRILRDGIQLEFIQELPPPPRPRLRLILGQSIPKGDRLEWLIQKATELGVSGIYPLITDRTIVRPSATESKIQRWNEIADHAAAQCESAQPAVVYPPHTLDRFLALHQTGLRLCLHERYSSPPLQQILAVESPSLNTGNSITFIVGPEGGWTAPEVESMLAAGFRMIHLGWRILRTETAGLALAAIIQYQCGDFSGP